MPRWYAPCTATFIIEQFGSVLIQSISCTFLETSMKSVSLLLAIIYSLCSSVEAGLYPTQPIAKTVFRAGAWNTITWIDSGDKPRLNELGRIQIELFNETVRQGLQGYSSP